MSIDLTREELEAGFSELLDGVFGVTQVLRDENLRLRAIVDEYRRLHALVPDNTDIVVALPPTVPTFTRPSLIEPAPVEEPPAKHKPDYNSVESERPCARCQVPSMRRRRSKFCDPCRRLNQSDVARRVTFERDTQKVAAAVDNRLEARQ